jgi:hypothetical protein
MNENRNESNTTRWVIIGCASVFAIILCCAAAVVGGLYWLGSLSTDDKAQINVTALSSVEQGQEYAITVEIRNISGREITLDSVDISRNLLNGFIIQTVEPSYLETYEYGGLGGEIYQTYLFQAVIPPGESLTVIFKGEAILSGDFNGEIDVCIDSSFNCKTDVIRTIVK